MIVVVQVYPYIDMNDQRQREYFVQRQEHVASAESIATIAHALGMIAQNLVAEEQKRAGKR